jgi:hypothetical protein
VARQHQPATATAPTAAPGPTWAFQPLLAELFGLTTARHPYVNLSDGGHFDNLGLYEVVLRRCRAVIVSDVGCDPAPASRTSATPSGRSASTSAIPIRFERRMRVFARPLDDKADRPGTAAPGERALYCAVARIDYGAVDRAEDGTPAPPGWLLYVKPQLDGAGAPVPLDVYAYGRGARAFPHEPTSDQWFDEAQFESYRALGEHVVAQILAGWTPDPADGGFAGLRAAVERYLDDAHAPGPGVPAGELDADGRRGRAARRGAAGPLTLSPRRPRPWRPGRPAAPVRRRAPRARRRARRGHPAAAGAWPRPR